ncbi:MAG: SUMF1/EgtB/PvdO family nonheme iron enzyme [Nitrospiraceae bacterium]
MSKILISYRREDSADVTGRIYDRLILAFPQSVFRDVDSIPLGVDFRTYLDEQVAKCEVLLAVIGRDWLRGKNRKGKSRLEDPGDFVRIEIESALKRQIPVIPVLVQGAKIPEVQRLPGSIQALSCRNGIVVRPDPDFHKDMDRLIAHLTQPVQGLSEPQAEPTTQSKSVPNEQQLVVSITPVDMVKVPKGPFLYGDQKIRVVIEHDYWIDQYPVTNEKYRAFIEAGGYENQQYWSSEGWQWKTKNNVTGLQYWSEAAWIKAAHPVVGVSYHEAEAYAKLAGKRFPTEQEWEKAARGQDGRKYPWGEEFEKDRCNSEESGIGHTTSVGQYPNGVSPYGCYDMAGNVWEWCTSWYDQSLAQRVIRGGSWLNRPEVLRASSRFRYTTDYRFYNLGFRLVQDLP